MDVRIAAGECLAFVAGIVAAADEEEGEEYSPYYFNGYFDVQDVLDGLSSQMPPDSGKRMNKNEKTQLRRGFKPLLRTFETGEAPTVALVVNSRQYEYSNWSEIQHLDFIRDILGSGFLPQMQGNPLLMSMFDIAPSPEQMYSMSKLEKV